MSLSEMVFDSLQTRPEFWHKNHGWKLLKDGSSSMTITQTWLKKKLIKITANQFSILNMKSVEGAYALSYQESAKKCKAFRAAVKMSANLVSKFCFTSHLFHS